VNLPGLKSSTDVLKTGNDCDFPSRVRKNELLIFNKMELWDGLLAAHREGRIEPFDDSETFDAAG